MSAAIGGAVSGVVGRARKTVVSVGDRVQGATAYVEEWGSDLIAEAREEATGASSPSSSAAETSPRPARVRGPNGRFVKGS